MSGMRDRRLVSALAVTVLLRLGFAALVALWTPSLAGFHALDTPSYILPARALAQHFTFSVDGVPDIYRTPGYSLLLVPGVWLGAVEAWAVLLNLALAAGTALGIHRLAGSLLPGPLGPRASLAAAWIYAVEPLSIFHAAQVTSETAFTCLLVLALEALVRGLGTLPAGLRLGPFAAAGAWLGAATLVRPVGLYLPWPLAALTLFAAFRLLPFPRRRAAAALPAACILALALAPALAWTLRNTQVTGYRGISAVVDINAWYFQAAAVQARLEGRSMMETRMALGYERELHLLAHPRDREGDPAAHFEELGRKASSILRAHPWTYLRIHLAGLLKVLTNPGASGYLVVYHRFAEVEAVAGVYPEGGAAQVLSDFGRMRSGFLLSNAALGLLLLAYYAAAFRGFLRAARTWSFGLSALALAIAYLLAVSGGANAVSRFRHPLMPLVCLFAGAGLALPMRPRSVPAGDAAGLPTP